MAGGVELEGGLALPRGASGVVVFAHGSGSSRHSPRNRFVARALREAGFGTLLFDLLTPNEEAVGATTKHLRFDIVLLAERLSGATRWLLQTPGAAGLAIGHFGASTGAGAALVGAAELPAVVAAVVSRGGRPDLAGIALPRVQAPTLLLVGSHDVSVIGLNRMALERLGATEKRLLLVSGATHLFEEPGALEEVARQAASWFSRHLKRPVDTRT
jgi:dienelactone hydrolase